ncbi:Negative regulator of mitosis [Colletotrichum trifolii]|uniref:Negative regulator of mitosis n=1 Tax=Colletotrichum trifolii TaxID=5466 RepID=A0A4R8RHJ3_COLTR|nr:Negative regulator of mitosis [Colletotrichum trifolii]
MASVKSLGLHQPNGLHHTAHGDGPPTNYSWEITTDPDYDEYEDGSVEVEDELLVTKDCVVWSRGGVFRKSFKFTIEKEPITQALLASFPSTEYDSKRGPKAPSTTKSNEPRRLSRALVVFLRTQAHIHFLSGTSHVVHMPFEVEAACAGPQGVIIQRKPRSDNRAPVSLKFPKVPPNSFVSSQITVTSPQSSQHTVFSVEGLNKPKSLPLRLGSTLGNMWEPTGQLDSRWPRLVSLMDPLQDLGLVVTKPEAGDKEKSRRVSQTAPHFLDPAEEILHIEEIKHPGAPKTKTSEPLILAVTINREASTYAVWRMTYIKNEDPFLGRLNKDKSRAERRRSSMQPNFASGASTPLQTNFRESFGAPLPGKRSRKSEKAEKLEKPLDLVSSLDFDKESGARRQSRRVSSMLARADLSASQERSVFAEQAINTALGGSRGSQGPRHSGGYGSFNYNHTIHPSLGSLLEAPIDGVLEELRAGGDFEGFHTMGLDDRFSDGLTQEVMFTKIQTISLDNANVRYSLSKQPARDHCKVFILSAPQFAVDDPLRGELLIGIQDSLDRRLQLLTIDLQRGPRFLVPPKPGKTATSSEDPVRLTCGALRRAHHVVDSCKVTDGDISVILILSEGHEGRRELSIQAPWSQITTINLPHVSLENTRSLDYRGRVVDRDVRHRKSEVIEVANGSVGALRYSKERGVVDIVDGENRHHQIQIQLQPHDPLVRKVLDACRSILPASHAEKMFPGWWHVMSWMKMEEFDVTDTEWSSLVVQLLTMYLALGKPDPKHGSPTKSSRHKRQQQSGSFGSIQSLEDWNTLHHFETPNGLGCPSWQQSRGWEWTLEEDSDEDIEGQSQGLKESKFMAAHIQYARAYLASPLGDKAVGLNGYFPTGMQRNAENRGNAAWNIFVALHLLLEEQKLEIMAPEYSSPGTTQLRVVMCQIARWLRWDSFVAMYEMGIQEDLEPRFDSELHLEVPLTQPSGVDFDIFHWIQTCLVTGQYHPFLTLANLYHSQTMKAEHDHVKDSRWAAITPRTLMFKRLFDRLTPRSSAADMVVAMHSAGIDLKVLETLPEAVLAPLRDSIARCQARPPASWSRDLLELVNRSDVSAILAPGKKPEKSGASIITPTHNASWDYHTICQSVEEYNTVGFDEGEGTERQAVIRALFKEDRRLNEAQDLLSTHRARIVRLEPHPTWSESEYLEKQKELVSRIATGTLAIPAGRAMLYYSLRYPLLTQKFPVGGFNLNCIVRPTNVTVGVDKSQFTEEKVCWGFFHQGVAAGLAISPQAKGIDTSWILYNKPGQELSNRHAGFLLALGMNGHLKAIAKWVAFKYLTPKHTMTSVGLLLGLAASHLGTMDSLITRLLSVHVTRMLPRGAAELNLSPLTQTTGIMGIGLLYCNSQHRRMSEIMMSEIEHVDEEDADEPLRSECYRLAAGFSLGFINLGKGNDLRGLHDMKLTESLVNIATATKKVEMVHVLDRAAAGAVMALTLIFMKSEDHIVARKVDVPDSIVQFDYIRPDILLLRTVAKNLIMWSKIEPTFEWIWQSLPRPYRIRHKLVSTSRLKSTDLPFFSIITGLCFSIALRYAGSASTRVRDLLIHYLDHFIRISRLPATIRPAPNDFPMYDEELARSNARMCQDVLALSTAIVMAGTGDVVVLRRLRLLHGRDDPDTPYGSHLAAHLAIGALFLGCGTATFGTSNMAIACLLVAFYPVFPTSVTDNRSHLQAFRHFWVLATDPRCLVAKDVATGQPISAAIEIRRKKDQNAPEDVEAGAVIRHTPCILPPIDEIASIRTKAGPAFWDLELNFGKNPALVTAFRQNQSLYLRRRPAQEAPFSSTLRALGRDALADATDNGQRDPLEWLFSLDALRNLTYAEQAIVLDCSAGSEGAAGESSASSVDARLVLERSMDGASRERLLGLKMLFEWADRRAQLESGSWKRRGDEDHTQEWWIRDSVVEELKGRRDYPGTYDAYPHHALLPVEFSSAAFVSIANRHPGFDPDNSIFFATLTRDGTIIGSGTVGHEGEFRIAIGEMLKLVGRSTQDKVSAERYTVAWELRDGKPFLDCRAA